MITINNIKNATDFCMLDDMVTQAAHERHCTFNPSSTYITNAEILQDLFNKEDTNINMFVQILIHAEQQAYIL